MRTAIFILTLLFNLRVGLTNRRVTKVIHEITWNPSVTEELAHGQIFRVDVRIGDYMDIFCPQYDADEVSEKMLQFVIYNVSGDAFEQCIVTDDDKRILECNQPSEPRKLTTKFQQRSPNPLGFTFKPGNSYHYIAFSDSTKLDCQNAMRMQINVHHRSISYHTKAPKVTTEKKGSILTTTTTTKKPITTTTIATTRSTKSESDPKKGSQVGRPTTGGSGSGGNASSIRHSPLLIATLALLATLLRT